MSKLNLKNNPELARQRHAEQQRAYYQRNKEYIKERHREYRLEKRLFKELFVCQETIPLDQALETLETLKQKEVL